MLLSRYNLRNVHSKKVVTPNEALFDLPEKVLQFGTGVLLRGLPDYFIDKANRQGVFNGRIVVVKSTSNGGSDAFDKQDGLYTLCVRGFDHGVKVEENIVCSAISRVLSASQEWSAVLECAHNPQMQVIISNTTEVGIQLVNEDVRKHPPVSFPGKLLAFLYERYIAFDGSEQSGMVIVPTELINNNAKKLESIVLELAHLNALDEKFIEWLENCNHFCNSLVDRIVPGADQQLAAEMEKSLGSKDELLIVSEVYRLWAIEGDESIAEVLSFAKADDGVVITPDITLFKELKLRLLNATHTLTCGVAYLAGIDTVKNGMDDAVLSQFITDLMMQEIATAIPYEVSLLQAEDFGSKVLDRFRNPFIQHHWLSITLNYTQKMKARAIPVLLKYYEKYQSIPENFATCFAAYLLFMKAVRNENEKYYGMNNGVPYFINDEKAAYYYDLWKRYDAAKVVSLVLRNTDLWDTSLGKLSGFEQEVTEKLLMMINDGMPAVLQTKKVLQEK
ncbi:MAG: tagaturonate reductase [Ferruginibacter sp.]